MMLSKLLVLSLTTAAALEDRGIIKLDNATFGRIVSGFSSVFVRFDKEYGYGDEHDAWKNFAVTVGSSNAEIIVANVGVSEYGDKDNSDLADLFSITSDSFPQYRLWKKGQKMTDSPAVYTGDKKEDAFLRFAQAEAGVWIGLPGQIKSLDDIVRQIKKGNKADAKSVLPQAEAAAEAAAGEELAKYYVKVIKKMDEDDKFITKEVTRLKKMVDAPSVKADKKALFGRRLNVLSSFE